MIERKPRTRFAPSPTGALHLGHARSYLVAWLYARKYDGEIVMRLEDLDGPRVVPGAAEAIYEDLRWLGLDWDEGCGLNEPGAVHGGPYAQSERTPLYEATFQRLTSEGFVFPCTCSRKEIQAEQSAPHGALGPIYPGTCRDAPSHDDRPAAFRFRCDAPPDFEDRIHGAVSGSDSRGDFVVKRADGLFAYQLAVVVDDIAMAITDVIRGDDLIPSTPRQVALYRALGAEVPRFAHVPLVLGPDGERLAKRNGATPIRELAARGVDRAMLLEWLAHSLGLSGLSPIDHPRDLLEDFALEKIPKRPVVIDDDAPFFQRD